MALEISKDGGTTRPKILDKILKFRKVALIIAYIGAYLSAQWLFDPVNMEVTRISEHSLMPGLVTPKFDKSGIAIQLYRRFSDLPKSKSQQELIHTIFSDLGLECFTHKWRSKVAGNPMNGENVYGFIRGPRNDGAEAQMIVVQLGRSEKSRRMMSRMLAFVDYAKDQVYWARDIVIVFVDGGEKNDSIEKAAFALDAFLLKYQKIEALNSKKSITVEADEIQAQTGALIGGVVYDLSGMAVKGQHIVNIQTNGLNGQQVNLDVFNGITKIADSKHHSRVAIFGTLHRHSNPYMEYSPFIVPMRALYTQAFISIEGIHSVLGKYGVQGLTVGLSHDYSEKQTGQFIEEVSRMLNNVLERLHQSYFMYVLADDLHFSSIAMYIIPLTILVSPLVISAYFEWTKIQEFQFPVVHLAFHVLGFFYYIATTYVFQTIGTTFVLQWMQWPFVGIDGCDGQFTPSWSLINSFLIFFMIPLGPYVFLKEPVRCVPSMRIVCLLETSLVLYGICLTNFGLAILCTAFVVPIVFLMTYESSDRTRSIFRSSVLAILNPISVLAFVAINIPGMFGQLFPTISQDSWLAAAQSIALTAIREDVEFKVNHFFLLCCFGYPIWNMLFACSMRYGPEPQGSLGIFGNGSDDDDGDDDDGPQKTNRGHSTKKNKRE
ncbi:Chitin synthase [Caenorhabditis elegans]|nr:Chitin synthase [Caenorhabditis elegans]CZR14437.1 Chitin synthase [Caenorhabditis elegans]|eukprot:NP_001309524.1 Uncharacterized protein CELE_F33D11.9 [Caenorhabditis elegans]